MATHKSAEKADRQSKVRAIRNQSLRAEAKTAVKRVRAQIAAGVKGEALEGLLKNAQSTLRRAASKGVLKPETVSRYVSRLSSAAHRASK
ncbi:MAG: 30S ribosomal protein S20 [Bdellovibrionales bacterium]|nr:30S ribosomal protein S20 [Bdellovibrionales bacterium]